MTRTVVQLRCHDVAQKVRWELAAGRAGLGLSEWLRRVADAEALAGPVEAEVVALAANEPDPAVFIAETLGVQGPVSRLFERRG